jgi:hypothetical protein
MVLTLQTLLDLILETSKIITKEKKNLVMVPSESCTDALLSQRAKNLL